MNLIIILTTYLGSYFCGKKRRKTKQCKVILSSNKINSINPDEDTMIPLTKITSALYSLKQYIGDYIKCIKKD